MVSLHNISKAHISEMIDSYKNLTLNHNEDMARAAPYVHAVKADIRQCLSVFNVLTGG